MTIVTDISKQMPTVRQPQRNFLAMLFVTILALRGCVTFRNLSRYCEYSERTHVWHDRFRRLVMNWEQTLASRYAFICLANTLIAYRI
jgi:hypothetical protein